MNRSANASARPGTVPKILLLAAVAVTAVRIGAVVTGALFGTAHLVAVDVIIAALVALTLWSWTSAGRTAGTPGTWADRVGGLAAVVALPALITATLNLFAPATPPSLPVAACAGAQTWNLPYHGRTVGPLGNYARTGPGVSFPQSGRFKDDCTLGFAGYCVGDPVAEPGHPTWVDTRWLLLGRHRTAPASWTARLSGEPAQTRFVSMAYIAPNSPDRDLGYLGDEVCDQGRPRPAKATMLPRSVPGGIGLRVTAEHAERVGVALAVPAGALRSGGSVRWVWSGDPDAPAGNGPRWIPAVTARDLEPERADPVPVTLVAAACLGPLHASAPDRAATLSYRINPDGKPARDRHPAPVPPALLDRLLRAACEVEGTAHLK